MIRRVAFALALWPVAALAVASLARNWRWPDVLPREWSLRAWQYVFSPASGAGEAFATSAAIATVVAIAAVLCALPAARALALRRSRAKSAVLMLMMLPVIAPPMASAMGLHGVFLRLGLADSVPGVMLVHLAPALTYATLMLAGSWSRFDTDLEAQARTLGAGAWAVWRHVTWPAIAPGVLVAFAFAFLVSWSQYLLTLLIGGGRVVTLPLHLVAFQRGGDEAITAALSLVFLAPALLAWRARHA